jgi:lysophospholipase L1-like esterase
MSRRRGRLVAPLLTPILAMVVACGIDQPSAGVYVILNPTTTLTADTNVPDTDGVIVFPPGTLAERIGDQPDSQAGGQDSTDRLPKPETVAVVGDSLTLSAVEELDAWLTDLGLDVLVIDGVENRRMTHRTRTVSSGADAISAILADESPDLWVIALGTNDVGGGTPALRDDVRTILDLIPDRVPVVWVDLWIRDLADEIVDDNQAIRSIVATRPRSIVVNWHSFGDDDGLIAGDGVHLTSSGQRMFAASIAARIDELLAIR